MLDPAFRAAQAERDKARETPERKQLRRASRKRRGMIRIDHRVKDRKTRAKEHGVPYEMPQGAGREPPIPAVCQMCFEPFGIDRPKIPSLDRVVPALGYVPANVQWIHHLCNSTKGARTLGEARAASAAAPDNVTLRLVVAYIERHLRCDPVEV